MSRPSRSPASYAAAWLLALLLLGLPLAYGGVLVWAQALAAGFTLLAALLLAGRDPRLSRTGVVLLAVLAVAVFQLIPLPPALHAVSPEARRLFDLSLIRLGLYPAARPLTLDPAASGRALLVAVASTAAFLAGHLLGETHRRRDLVLAALGASAILVALAVFGSALLGLRPFLAPTAPFVNPNHLAGFLVLTTFPMLGLALRRYGQARLAWLLGFAVAAAVIFLSLSRGGIAAFLLGVVIFVSLRQRRERRPGEPARSGRAILAGGLAGALGLAAYLAFTPVLGELGTLRAVPGESKIDLWAPAFRVISAFPLTGVGRGAFESVFPAFKSGTEQTTYTHVENEWLQVMVDLGIPGGLLLVGALAWTWVSAARRRDLSPVEVGLLAGTGALAAQNVLDFSLELAGVAVPFMLAMGLLARGSSTLPLRPWVFRGGIAAMAAAAAVGLGTWAARPGDAAPTAVQLAWRPADYRPPATEGVLLVREGKCAPAMAWLNLAMLLSPTAPEAHLHAARCLAAAHQDAFAKREYRLALMYGSEEALPEAASRYTSYEDLVAVVPEGADGLLRLGQFLRGSNPEVAEQALLVALNDFGDGRALLPLSEAVMKEGRQEEAIELARRRTRQAPREAAAWHQAAWFLVVAGRPDEARVELEQGLAELPGSTQLVQLLGELALSRRRFGEAHLIAEQMVARTGAETAAKHLLVARALAGQGRFIEAAERARSAASAQPDATAPYVALAQLCEAAGQYDDAIAALEHLRGFPGQPVADIEERLAALRAAHAAQADTRSRQQVQAP